jgi:hypothetical protein
MPCKIPIGNSKAPAIKKPHKPSAKHVKTCVNHAAMQANAIIQPIISPVKLDWQEAICCQADRQIVPTCVGKYGLHQVTHRMKEKVAVLGVKV